MSRLKILCGTCGSSNVRRDAFAAWDEILQEWVLEELYDNGHCVVCEGDARLEEVEIKEAPDVGTHT